jgi:hypothetical protein
MASTLARGDKEISLRFKDGVSRKDREAKEAEALRRELQVATTQAYLKDLMTDLLDRTDPSVLGELADKGHSTAYVESSLGNTWRHPFTVKATGEVLVGHALDGDKREVIESICAETIAGTLRDEGYHAHAVRYRHPAEYSGGTAPGEFPKGGRTEGRVEHGVTVEWGPGIPPPIRSDDGYTTFPLDRMYYGEQIDERCGGVSGSDRCTLDDFRASQAGKE